MIRDLKNGLQSWTFYSPEPLQLQGIFKGKIVNEMIRPTQVEAKGLGDWRPIMSDKAEAGRTENRLTETYI